MSQKIAIIDYAMGNLLSVKRKLDRLGAEAALVSDASELKNYDKFILPGVGHFKKAVEQLKSNGMWEVLNELVLIQKKPILGICLGAQLMCSFSEEGNEAGFGWFDAQVVRFKVSDSLRFKVPHTGWNEIKIHQVNPLMNGIDSDTSFYFVHAYHFQTESKEIILNTSDYEQTFVSALAKENIFGVQYHPEKSHDQGNKLLANFIEI